MIFFHLFSDLKKVIYVQLFCTILKHLPWEAGHLSTSQYNPAQGLGHSQEHPPTLVVVLQATHIQSVKHHRPKTLLQSIFKASCTVLYVFSTTEALVLLHFKVTPLEWDMFIIVKTTSLHFAYAKQILYTDWFEKKKINK